MRPLRSSWLFELLAWRQKLGVRIVALLVVVSVAFAAVGSWLDFRVEERAMRQRLLEHGRSMIRQAVLVCPDYILSRDWPRVVEYVEALVKLDPALEFGVVQRSDGVTIAQYPQGAVPRPSETTLLLAEPIFAVDRESEIATFYLGLSQKPMLAALRGRTARLLLRSGVTFLLVGAVLWFVLRLVVVRPLHHLDAQAQRLGRGELDAPLPDFGATEIGRLGRTLDEMRHNLQRSHVSLADQNRRLKELDRFKSEFLANMSHELRTPLTSVLGGLQLLADPATATTERAEFVASVRRNGQQMLELVDRLLDLTKIESGSLLVQPRPCRPAEVVTEACAEAFARGASKGLACRVDVAAIADQVVLTDPHRLRQLVSAIVDNAVKFTATGEVVVAAKLLTATSRRLSIVVTDTGPGIPADFLGEVFAPFRQVDGSVTRRHGGSGLGLFIAQQIARRLGGDVVVASKLGSGTRVEITIDAPVVAVEPAAPEAAAPPRNRKARVLVVDDAPDNRLLLKAVLGKLGLSVELAVNGRVAVDRVAAEGSGAFDLVLMDLQMPELDGIGAIRELRSRGFDLPIVALTAHALAEDRDRTLAAGADGYETKPVSVERLGEIVAAHVRTTRG